MTLTNITEAVLEAYAEQFAEFADANAAELGLSPAQVAAIQTLAQDFRDDRLSQIEAQNAARAATDTKNRAERELLALIRTHSNQWRANPALPDALLLEGGIERRRRARKQRPLNTPKDFAIRFVQGNKVRLQWQRNGNAPDTTFIVETRAGSDAKWTIVGVTTRQTFDFVAESVSEPIAFRLCATRGMRKSEMVEGPIAFTPLGNRALMDAAA